MENHQTRSEQKLTMIMQHTSMGLAEIDRSGKIIHLNTKGESLLRPIWIANGLSETDLYPVLELIAPALSKKISESPDEAGQILTNELHSFSFFFGGERIERHFNFMVIKMFTDCIIIGFDDITQKRQTENAIQKLLSEKAVVQGKFEIASNILHDIGNAVVGFGSYVTRIKRSLEQNNPENLQKLADFFATQQTAMTVSIGEAKAGAVIKMLNGITESQKNTQEEISKSVIEQLHIITHIQDILNIQRQYVNGHETQERKKINLRTIIKDCMSMLFASIEKRSINVSISIPEVLPVIMGDHTRLMQVILNLLKNSIEAIDINAAEKTISLSVSIESDMLVLQVRDNGHGFDEKTGGQIFKRGFTTKASGSGLGLSNCRTIIESHDGTIDFSSEGFGKGALATIKFKI
jgi:signal transduction histidine kinase